MYRMRWIFALFTIFLFSCDRNNDRASIVNEGIIGKWQLEATKISPGGGVIDWETVSKGEVYEFSEDGSFKLSNSKSCAENITGTYAVKADKLSLTYTCGTIAQQPNFFMSFADNKLILGFIGCIEECSYRYKPIN